MKAPATKYDNLIDLGAPPTPKQLAARKLWYAGLLKGLPQIKSALQNKSGYCCLGIACQIAFDNNIIGPPEISINANMQYLDNHGYNSSSMPSTVSKWLGFGSCDPYTAEVTLFDQTQISFSSLNDSYDFDFSQIAAVLKRDFINPFE